MDIGSGIAITGVSFSVAATIIAIFKKPAPKEDARQSTTCAVHGMFADQIKEIKEMMTDQREEFKDWMLRLEKEIKDSLMQRV